MTVKELISKLSKVEQAKEVHINLGGDMYIEDVEGVFDDDTHDVVVISSSNWDPRTLSEKCRKL